MTRVSMTPPDGEQYQPYWQPGVPLPLSQCSTPVSRNPRPVPMFTMPPASVPMHHLEPEEEYSDPSSETLLRVSFPLRSRCKSKWTISYTVLMH